MSSVRDVLAEHALASSEDEIAAQLRILLAAPTDSSAAGLTAALGIDQTRISHRTRAGALFGYPGAAGRRRYPNWQFVDGATVPHLAAVLAAVPAGTHPVTLRTFMTTPDDALLLDGGPASPVRWLVAGGSPDAVAALAPTLGEQV